MHLEYFNYQELPKIDDFFDQLLGLCYFTKIDLRLGYHQVCIKMQDISKTTFKTRFGHFEFLVMPFGLTNALAMFKTLMDSALHPYLGKFVIIFLDDILIYNGFKEEHIHLICLVFELLRTHKLYAKENKCEFLKQQVHYLGHVIIKDG